MAGLAEESSEERSAAKRGFFPSSIGLSFLVSSESDDLAVTVRWGAYSKDEHPGSDGKPIEVWRRHPQERTVAVALSTPVADHPVPGSGGLRLHVVVRAVETERLAGLPAGTRSVSVFLINGRGSQAGSPDDPESADDAVRAYVFQAEIEVSGDAPFVPRPDPRGAMAIDWDDQVADLHYADVPAYATGHGTSADWETINGECRVLRTTWIPSATVAKTETAAVPDAELSMEALVLSPTGQQSNPPSNRWSTTTATGSTRRAPDSATSATTGERRPRSCCGEPGSRPTVSSEGSACWPPTQTPWTPSESPTALSLALCADAPSSPTTTMPTVRARTGAPSSSRSSC